MSRLTIVVPEPAALATPEFRVARELFLEVVRGLRGNVLLEEKRPTCEQALVTDEHGGVRAFAQLGGSDDSYSEIRHFFARDGALRFLLYLRNDVEGGSSQDLVAFDPKGDVTACRHVTRHSGMAAPDLCADENPEPQLDPDVKKALQPSGHHRTRNRLRESLQAVDPRATFQKCSP